MSAGNNNSVSIYILEEHHEAFFIWRHTINEGRLAPENNVLFHIDSHEDMALPVLRESINSLKRDTQNLIDFTYNELNIASFITPAVYLEIFNNIYWFNPVSPGGNQTCLKKYIRTHKEEGKIFITGKDASPWPHNRTWQDRVCFRYHKQSIRDTVRVEAPVVLDIDLDFFDCARIANNCGRIEVTEEQYLEVKNNRYSRLRLRLNCYAEKEEGRFYLYFNRDLDELINQSSKSSEKDIRERLILFKDFLVKNKVKPVIITISRSRYSGYTPCEHLEFIESNVVSILEDIYKKVSRMNVDEVAKNIS